MFRLYRRPVALRMIGRMPTSLDGQLVVAISSRALFDFEEENQLFEATDDRAYMRLQLDRLDHAAKPGVAFSLVNKLLAFNTRAPAAPASAERTSASLVDRNRCAFNGRR